MWVIFYAQSICIWKYNDYTLQYSTLQEVASPIVVFGESHVNRLLARFELITSGTIVVEIEN